MRECTCGHPHGQHERPCPVDRDKCVIHGVYNCPEREHINARQIRQPLAAARAEGEDAERARIVAYLRSDNALTRGPITDSKAIPCEHGAYSWVDCEPCTLIQVADAIERGEHAAGGDSLDAVP